MCLRVFKFLLHLCKYLKLVSKYIITIYYYVCGQMTFPAFYDHNIQQHNNNNDYYYYNIVYTDLIYTFNNNPNYENSINFLLKFFFIFY